MSELFGTNWPDQPIEFRYDGGRPPENSTRMILKPAGIEVPYQWVSSCSDSTATKGCIVVRSSLPANANYTWILQSGTASAAAVRNPVRVSRQGPNYEITNGLTGIRIVAPESNPRPWHLAPIQGILLPDGTWTGAGTSPNLLYAEAPASAGDLRQPRRTPMYTVTGYDVSLTDAGPMKTVVKATYTFERPRYFSGTQTVNSAGAGHYTLIVTMYSNSKSMLIDEDSDMQFSYYLPVYAQLMPDQVRYRGHDPGTDGPICGYEAVVPVSEVADTSPVVMAASYGLSNGQEVLISGVQGNAAANGKYYAKTTGYATGQFALYRDATLITPVSGSGTYTGEGIMEPAYRGWLLHPARDAYLDMTYTGDRPASAACTSSTYRKLVTSLPPNDHGAGWYVEMYQSAAGRNAPVVGIYTGRSSQMINAGLGPSMPGIYSSNRHWTSGTRDAGIQVDNLLRGPDNRVAAIIHRNWAIWVSTQADLAPPDSHQPIADDQNSLASINLSHLYTYQLIYTDPPGGWRWLYMQPSSAQQLIEWIRNGTSLCGSPACYYNLLAHGDISTAGRTLLAMWRGNTTAAVQTALNTATSLARQITDNLTSGDGHWQPRGYYESGQDAIAFVPLLNAVLMDSNSTLGQKSMAKALLALFGCIQWDNDWFPIDNPAGGGVGLSNQYEAYLQYRTQFVAAAPSQPVLASKLATAIGYAVDDFNQYFSSTGAAAGSTHYQSAFFDPLILNYQALTLDGYLSMKDPKWVAYANWELSIQTPPEPRFGNVRKVYSNGNGNTEADERTGMLAAALYPVNPGLARNLMWAWQQSNSPSVLTETPVSFDFIDPTIPAVAPRLTSINIPGYHSVERHGFGTPDETVVWFINGSFYSAGGHRHNDDGQVTIYAHSAPLSIDWNANLYYPDTGGRFMHNSIVYDSELKHPWNADNTGLMDVYTLMKNPTNTEFGAFPNSTTATATFTAADGTVWTRMVRTMAFTPSYPIIYVTDTFAGPSATAGKTLTWNLMATGPVSTPAGWITPIPRFSSRCQQPAGALPSNGVVKSLGSGLQAFSFTGAAWPKHATGGIDWDLFTLSNTTTQQFFIGNWGHGCHSGREVAEYKQANGTPFAESQHILRIHDTGPFTTIILPFRKTEPPSRTVTQQACGVQIVQGVETTCFNPSAATYSNGASSILTAYDDSSQSAFGVSVSSGPQEVVIQPDQIRWTVSGIHGGPRILTLPGGWHPSTPLAQTGSTFTYTYQGGAQATPVTIIFSR